MKIVGVRIDPLIIAVLGGVAFLIAGMWDASTPPQTTKLTRTPSIAEFNELKSRVDNLENLFKKSNPRLDKI